MPSLVKTVSLDGEWEVGPNRRYNAAGNVPGMPFDPAQDARGTAWYRRILQLPEGRWTHATLLLRGARWSPVIYVNGRELSRCEGGMAPTRHLLAGDDVRAGQAVRLEIELTALSDVDSADASWLPLGERWRTNLAAGLWDSAELRCHGPSRIARVVPRFDYERVELRVDWQIEQMDSPAVEHEVRLELFADEPQAIRSSVVRVAGVAGRGVVKVGELEQWHPDNPKCYRLRVSLLRDGVVVDVDEMTIGLRTVGVAGSKVTIAECPLFLRGVVIAWQRWLRDGAAHEWAWHKAWFKGALVDRLRALGGNAIRFTGGMPPSGWLDICDHAGIAVQVEWPALHELRASDDSLRRQWRCWLDELARHPCVVIVRGCQDVPEPDRKRACAVMSELLADYDRLIIADRDTLGLQKHWWALFENVGLYYDSLGEHGKPVIIDEFAGIYLDENGAPGGHPSMPESLLRFLGPNHDAETRLAFQADVAARMGEYWRRIGAAGMFLSCALSSREDGNTHFRGELSQGEFKPVWDAMYAAWASISVSMDVWDRNFEPGKGVTLAMYLVNGTDTLVKISASAQVSHEDGYGHTTNVVNVSCPVGPHDAVEQFVTLRVPAREGRYRFSAVLDAPPSGLEWPAQSLCPLRAFAVKSLHMGGLRAAIADEEPEMMAFAEQNQVGRFEDLTNPRADMVIIGPNTWSRFVADAELRQKLQEGIEEGRSVLFLDAGPRWLGPDYPDELPELAAGVARRPGASEVDLLGGVRLAFREMPEPESCIHPSEVDESLWERIPCDHTHLWNGLRGGLIVPAVDMEPLGLSPESFLELWKSRGARADMIRGEQYFAYELHGFYAFSLFDDEEVRQALRARVRFLAEDSEALRHGIDPHGPIRTIDLSDQYRRCLGSSASRFVPLASAGKRLSRAPVVQIDFESGMGRVVISQLITQGRLARGFGTPGRHGLRYDPVAVQFTLNMIRRCVLGR
jgi:beta-galactosidase